MKRFEDCRNDGDRDLFGLCAAGIGECYDDCPFYFAKTTGMGFGGAIHAAKAGKKIARQGWNGKNMWVILQVPDEHSKMSLPYFYIEYPVGHVAYPNGSRVPWLASQTDMLAEDWMVVE